METHKAYAPVPIVRDTTLKGKFRGNGADWVCFVLVANPMVVIVKDLLLEEETLWLQYILYDTIVIVMFRHRVNNPNRERDQHPCSPHVAFPFWDFRQFPAISFIRQQ